MPKPAAGENQQKWRLRKTSIVSLDGFWKDSSEWGIVAACKNGPESDISYLSISQKGTDPQSYFFGTPLVCGRAVILPEASTPGNDC
jgi:hypothetical protein